MYKQMIRQRAGCILNISSIGAMRALPTAVHYATSKAAMIGFTKCLSREAENFGVMGNGIAAGNFRARWAPKITQQPLIMAELLVSSRRPCRPAGIGDDAAHIFR